jgi:hypothetical protein
LCPVLASLSAGSLLAIYLDLLRDELQATTVPAGVNHSASVAAMQEQATISRRDGSVSLQT